MSQLGSASDGSQIDHPDIRHLRRLYERGQCRSVGQPTEAAHRLDRHREDHPGDIDEKRFDEIVDPKKMVGQGVAGS
jgi:hypothetical protein